MVNKTFFLFWVNWIKVVKKQTQVNKLDWAWPSSVPPCLSYLSQICSSNNCIQEKGFEVKTHILFSTGYFTHHRVNIWQCYCNCNCPTLGSHKEHPHKLDELSLEEQMYWTRNIIQSSIIPNPATFYNI